MRLGITVLIALATLASVSPAQIIAPSAASDLVQLHLIEHVPDANGDYTSTGVPVSAIDAAAPTFEIRVTGPAGWWYVVHATAYIPLEAFDLVDDGIDDGVPVEVLQKYPWILPPVTDLPSRWSNVAFSTTETSFFGAINSLEQVMAEALDFGAHPVDGVRYVAQPMLSGETTRLWDVGCPSWTTHVGDGFDFWSPTLLPPATPDTMPGGSGDTVVVSNTTVFEPTALLLAVLERDASPVGAFDAFLNDPVHGMAVAGDAFLLSLQVIAVSPATPGIPPLAIPTPAGTEEGTGGLTDATGSLLPLILSLSGGATVSFTLQKPFAGGGADYHLNGHFFGPLATGAQLTLTLKSAVTPLRARIDTGSAIRNVWGTYVDPRTVAFPLPNIPNGTPIQVLELENAWGLTDTSTMPWGHVVVGAGIPNPGTLP